MAVSIETGNFLKSNRINNPGDYRQVFKSSCRSTDKCFLVLARTNNFNFPRLGLAVPKKNIRQAVLRNRVKRLIRESFRKNKKRLAGLDVVVVAHRKQLSVNNKILFESLNSHWDKISQCKKS